MLNGRKTNPMCFATIILLLSIILMIQDCDGYPATCNGSSAAECKVVFVEEEEEFMMDTEEHRRILAGTNGGHIGYGALQPGNPACGNNCAGRRYDRAGRKCKLYDRSCR
ncbi:rapid alkalinization factor [Tanacetum coccineum]